MSWSYQYGDLSWSDHLKVKQLEGIGAQLNKLHYELSSSDREAIGTLRELRCDHFESSEMLSAGLERLSFDLDSISDRISELTGVFEWGFSELIIGVTHINDSLQELIKIAKTPAQAWAYEQFEMARNAFRQQLYEEALEYLDRAIGGHGGNPGYRLDYRFHFLLGTILLGSFRNNSTSVIDTAKAESAFLSAARYARHDYPKEAGRALLSAGWAAYCQGKMSDAERLTREAVLLHPKLGEAHFQLAKILMHESKSEEAILPLQEAVRLDRDYIIKAAADDDFRLHGARLSAFIRHLQGESSKSAGKSIRSLEELVLSTEQLQVAEFRYSNNLGDLVSEAKSLAGSNTYFGCLDAITLCGRAARAITNSQIDFLASAIKAVQAKLADNNAEIVSTRSKEGISFRLALIVTAGIVLSFILGARQCSNVQNYNRQQASAYVKAEQRMNAELMRKGLDPRILTPQQRMHYWKVYEVPPLNLKNDFFAWLKPFFLGAVASILLGILADRIRRNAVVTDLERERARLKLVGTELESLKMKAQSNLVA